MSEASVTRATRLPCRVLLDDCKPIWTAMDDLRQCGNRILTELYLVRQGVKQPPTIRGRDGKEKTQPLRSYAYSLMAGTCGVSPVYTPGGRIVSGGVKSAFSSAMYQRLQTDWKEIQRGEKSLSNLTNVPIPLRAQEVKIVAEDRIRLLIWASKTGPSCSIAIRVFPRGAGQRAVWRHIRGGDYKLGDCRLSWDKRRKRWFFSASFSMPVKNGLPGGEEDRALGVDINMVNLAACEAVNGSGIVRGSYREFPLPVPFWRLFERELKARRERQRCNQKEYGLRVGRGRSRKLRVSEVYGDRFRRTIETAAKHLASAVIAHAKNIGCSTIVVEDFSDYDQLLVDETEQMSRNRQRRRHYRTFLRFNRYRLLKLIGDVAEREGLVSVPVSRAGTTKTCSACGKPGRLETKTRRLYCDCGGLRGGWIDRDRNAARNIAIRGLQEKTK